MPGLLYEGGLTMTGQKKRGVFADSKTQGAHTDPDNLKDRVADFSYESDALAQLIVEMWAGQHSDLLKDPSVTDYRNRSANAKAALEARGIYLTQPIVVTEDEYDDGFSLADANLTPDQGVVFVLPRYSRVSAAQPLLETAKMLMAITPNGI